MEGLRGHDYYACSEEHARVLRPEDASEGHVGGVERRRRKRGGALDMDRQHVVECRCNDCNDYGLSVPFSSIDDGFERRAPEELPGVARDGTSRESTPWHMREGKSWKQFARG